VRRFRYLLAPGTGEGYGCVCGWQHPRGHWWPFWFFHNRIWDAHLRDCPVERDANGEVIRLEP
jgi:hypothetical protein